MYKRILTMQDISCVGQCSMTVALPVLSVCGLETCILPSKLLSTHTGGFTDVKMVQLQEEISGFWQHWKREGLGFDGFYSGYLGGIPQIQEAKKILLDVSASGGCTFVDPAMADGGKLYKGFDREYADAMKELCACADVILPNITEACLLTGMEYREEYGESYIQALLDALSGVCTGSIVLTGVGYCPGQTGVVIRQGEKCDYFQQEKLPKNYHGTGDLFAACLVGSFMGGDSLLSAAALAAEFVAQCIRNTLDDPAHRYGVKFEMALPWLINRMNKG